MTVKFETYKEIERIINNNLNVRTISEELKCFNQEDDPKVVREFLVANGFDLVGIELNGNVIGYTDLGTLEESESEIAFKEFKQHDIVSSNTSLVETVALISKKNHLFVLDGTAITRIVTKADIYKEPVRLFLYNQISNFETLLSILVEHYYPDKVWISRIDSEKLEEIDKIYESRKRENTEFDMFDCLSLELKINLFLEHERLKDIFGISKKQQKKFFERLKTIRNAISHVGKNPAIASVEKIMSMITDVTHFSHLLSLEIDNVIM